MLKVFLNVLAYVSGKPLVKLGTQRKINLGDKMTGFQLGLVEIKESKIRFKRKSRSDLMFIGEGCGEDIEVEPICRRD